MEYGNRNGFWLHKTFHMTTFHLITWPTQSHISVS
jgi:hypothetical protein